MRPLFVAKDPRASVLKLVVVFFALSLSLYLSLSLSLSLTEIPSVFLLTFSLSLSASIRGQLVKSPCASAVVPHRYLGAPQLDQGAPILASHHNLGLAMGFTAQSISNMPQIRQATSPFPQNTCGGQYESSHSHICFWKHLERTVVQLHQSQTSTTERVSINSLRG